MMDSQVSNASSNAGPCLICKSDTSYYFSKDYPTYQTSPFEDTLTVDYHKCERCGFVISATHQQMSEKQWSALNSTWHHQYESDPESHAPNSPPYADQALALAMLGKNELIDLKNSLDYAAGYGTLSKFMSKYFDIEIPIFDRYVQDKQEARRYIAENALDTYRLVINSAMFEHVLRRDSLDEINNLVTSDGALMIHTVICERIPMDPNWFYLTPMVHTSFHTNKSMQILMEQWDYSVSVYSPQAKSWILFKKNHPKINLIESIIQGINKELQTTFFHFKRGFVDYWKGF